MLQAIWDRHQPLLARMARKEEGNGQSFKGSRSGPNKKKPPR
jgi:hypothetical protein